MTPVKVDGERERVDTSVTEGGCGVGSGLGALLCVASKCALLWCDVTSRETAEEHQKKQQNSNQKRQMKSNQKKQKKRNEQRAEPIEFPQMESGEEGTFVSLYHLFATACL